MRLHILSDVHLESGRYEVPEGIECDVIVAAGDIAEGVQGVEFLKALNKPVVYVLGNHEYYSSGAVVDMAHRLAEIRHAATGTQVHVLENEALILDGVRFLGATLWTDFGAAHPGLLQDALLTQHDYQRIDAANWHSQPANQRYFLEAGAGIWGEEELRADAAIHRFHPLIALALHRQALAWLDEQLAQPFDGDTVVVTHHHPSFESLRRSDTDDRLLEDRSLWNHAGQAGNGLYRVASYASDLSAMLHRQRGAIVMWVCGHLHTHLDYREHGIRIVCNPRGRAIRPHPAHDANCSEDFNYPGKARGFDPRFVIELKDAELEKAL